MMGCGRKLGLFECCSIYQSEALELLRQLPAKCADLILTDPPYGHTENGSLQQRREAVMGWKDGQGVYRDGDLAYAPLVANDGAEATPLYRSLLVESKRLLDEGCCCCCCGGGGPDPQFARWSLLMDEIVGFKMCVVWDKGGLGMGWHYRRNWECVLVSKTSKWYGGNSVPNVVNFPKIIPQSDEHPTAKPIELFSFFIVNHTQPAEMVIDPFCGGGASLIAAKKLGRHYLGIDIDAHWVEYSRDRIALVEAQPTLFEKPKVTQAMFDEWLGKE